MGLECIIKRASTLKYVLPAVGPVMSAAYENWTEDFETWLDEIGQTAYVMTESLPDDCFRHIAVERNVQGYDVKKARNLYVQECRKRGKSVGQFYSCRYMPMYDQYEIEGDYLDFYVDADEVSDKEANKCWLWEQTTVFSERKCYWLDDWVRSNCRSLTETSYEITEADFSRMMSQISRLLELRKPHSAEDGWKETEADVLAREYGFCRASGDVIDVGFDSFAANMNEVYMSTNWKDCVLVYQWG